MTQADELEIQIMELRERYDAVVNRRIQYLSETGFFDTANPDQCDNPDYEMEALEDWIGDLKMQLMELKPEKFAYGRRKKLSSIVQSGTEFTRYGDNGYFICLECKGLFECGVQNKERELTGNERESFERCSEHEGRKKIGTMVLKAEELPV